MGRKFYDLAPIWAFLGDTPISIDLFHNNFFPSGEQPERRKLAHVL